ncbi:hypothetical protein [Demequina soli]|uniref:hypothetical protein n=1 Tax=Demequina soli TaxID=1638987 RepID=UPI000783632A|nr:hypothetical protein [Demequina soli]
MSGLPSRAREVHEGAPPCSVHPYGYHRSPQVGEPGSASVFRERTLLGLPARCALLEEELMESERELDLLDELWVRERATGTWALTALAASFTGAATAIAALSDVSGGGVAAVVVGGALVTVLAARGESALRHARLARVRDWHRRVGVPR